ncbi:MAG: ABC transporter permease [Acidimicrobiia bacterium]
MTATTTQDRATWVRSRPGWTVVARKEFADHLLSARFLAMISILGLVAVGTVYGAAQSLGDVAQDASSSGIGLFLRLFTVNADPVPFSFITFLGFLAPILGIAYGFDTISGEVSQGTLPRLVAQPIHRDDVINGKFVAGLGAIGVIMTTVTLLVAGLGILMLGIVPTPNDLIRLVVWLIATMAYVSIWLALATLMSVVFRGSATPAVVCIGFWLLVTLFGGLLAQLGADVLSPVSPGDPASPLHNAQTELTLSRLSPAVLYDDASTALLIPEVRTLGIITYQQIDRAVSSSLTAGQSVLLVWPQIVGMMALTVVLFAAAYITFMRREVRA